MLYHLVKYFSQHFDIPGVGMFLSLSFRAAMAIILALTIGMIFGRKIIRLLQRRQIGEEVRNLGLEGQLQKRGTPTMGGLIILLSILVPILLLGDLTNVYTQLMIVSTVWLGLIGFLDDYIKVFRKRKEGLSGRYKIVGQVGLGVIVGCAMWLSPQIVVKEKLEGKSPRAQIEYVTENGQSSPDYVTPAEKSDGLASGVSATIVVTLGILAYLSGNVIYADYLNIMYIPSSGELVVYAAAFAGALFGFLWYNCYPAQVFMGDTGSLAIGGIIAVFALLIRKELLLPILCGIFFVESLSVIFQVGWFKYTKRRYGEGRRVLLMAPLHHHYQKKGYFESKIVVRFWIAGGRYARYA